MARRRFIPDKLDRWFDRHPLVFFVVYMVAAGSILMAISDALGAFQR